MCELQTQMAPLAAIFMLGHTAELLAKAHLLQRGLATEKQLKHHDYRERFGHCVENMWRKETDLFRSAENHWEKIRLETSLFSDVDFDLIFSSLAQLHNKPYASRYGGTNKFPVHEPLLKVLSLVFEDIEFEHNATK